MLKKSLLVVLVLLLLMFSSMASFATPRDVSNEIQSLLQMLYVEPLGDEIFLNNSIDNVLNNYTDTHTVYFDPVTFANFLRAIDQSFSGIGIYIEIVPEGVLVVSVMPGSPSMAAGLMPGDIIVKANGVSLGGLSNEEAVSKIRGPEGTVVNIEVKRGRELISFSIIRRAIEVPTVEGRIKNNNIGEITIRSFGSHTAEDFIKMARELRNQGAKSWIIDLRYNGGGYLQSALDIAGYFVGEEKVLIAKNEKGDIGHFYSEKQQFFNNDNVVVLVNRFSASASEILAGALKDHKRATIIGETTFGKGSIQQIYTLSNGGALKLTVSRFFSPLEHLIDGVGINPHIEIEENILKAAELLLSGKETISSQNNRRILVNNRWFNINLELARQTEYWPAYNELLRALRRSILPEGIYPGYRGLGSLNNVERDKSFNIVFSMSINMEKAIIDGAIELIDAETGVRLPLNYTTTNNRVIKLIPEELLETGKTYWLLFHREIVSTSGKTLNTPTYVEVKVKN